MRVLALCALVAIGCGQKEEPKPEETQPAAKPPAVDATPKPDIKVRSAQAQPKFEASKATTTESGLQYIVETEGTGKRPSPGDIVKVHYTGWLLSGRKFDSSRSKGMPFRFKLGVGAVIEGWDETVALMTVGSRWTVQIPSRLAYGARGTPGIPANADLIFDVELLDFTKGDPVPAFRPPDAAKLKSTKSGLKYEVLEEGTGEPPAADHIVSLRYYIWTTDGKLFATSEGSGPPLGGPCGQLKITPLREKFLAEAAQLMRKGAKVRFEVPPRLCWGARELHAERMPAHSTTIWHMELLDVRTPPKMPVFRSPDPTQMSKTDSGLQFQVVEAGSGKQPERSDAVTVYYTGWLEDGTEFDSAHRRQAPATFSLAGVIPGWTEGLQLMREGGVYLFRIPPKLAYGPARKGKIPPNSTLIFLVELVRVN